MASLDAFSADLFIIGQRWIGEENKSEKKVCSLGVVHPKRRLFHEGYVGAIVSMLLTDHVFFLDHVNDTIQLTSSL